MPLTTDWRVHKILLAGWAFSDVVRYMAVLGKDIQFLQVARRVVSSILFAVVASTEAYSSWLVMDHFSGFLKNYMLLQVVVTAVGVPVGSYVFMAAARNSKSGEKKKR